MSAARSYSRHQMHRRKETRPAHRRRITRQLQTPEPDGSTLSSGEGAQRRADDWRADGWPGEWADWRDDPSDAPSDAPSDDALGRSEARAADQPEVAGEPPDDRLPLSLDGLSVAGVTRRRMALVAGGVLSVWIVVLFARQVGDASAATARADKIREANAVLAAEVESRSRELELIQKQNYILQQARAYQLGGRKERPFTLAPDAPLLGDDASGSESLRLGARHDTPSPLESWLSLLFGPSE